RNNTVLEAYRQHVAERAALGVPPKPLDDAQTAALVELLKNPPAGEEAFLVDLLENRVPAGVDQAAYVKAAFLAALAKGEATSPLVSKERAVYLLGTMLGGYNVAPLVALLDDAALAELAAEALKKTLLVFDAFHDVADKAKAGNANAQAVMQSWADAEWFTTRKDVPTEIKLTVFKVTGETNTDDLSPAQDAWSRPDIPLHANAMLKNVRDGINPEVPGEVGPLNQIKDLIAKGNQVAYVGDVVGTGSSRKSATNSVLWFFGDEIAHIPNKKDGGYCLAREALGLAPSTLFRTPVQPAATGKGFTQAQKMVGRACGLPEGQGVLPGTYCEPKMTTVGSQDTTGPMTRDELKDLACLGFSADLVMQSFCHTAAYPKPVDVQMQHSLPDFIMNRGGVSLRPGDGIIHSWLNRMLLPDTVGTGGDSHTRFPIGISFPAGSGLVAFAAATGVMPLDMPESVLVKFKGKMQPGITLRDLVHAIPYVAIQQGDLTVEKKGKKNIFSGRILEIDLTEMETDLTVEQAFELSDASAERSAAGCSITLSEEKVAEYLKSNITMLKWMISEGYGDARTMARRVENMEKWLANPSLLKADADAEYTKVYEIDLATITEPVLCCPNDPDDAKLLSDVQGVKIDEVFVGSCMTNIGHFRATGKLLEKVPGGVLSTRLWIAPPTRMDERQLMEEGFYNTYGKAGARTEMPGCSLCMGNQARVAPNTTCVSTSTRNFPNRLGQGANVYLASAELASVAAVLGKLPTPEEYQQYAAQIDSMSADIYQYLSFDKMGDYTDAAANVDTKKIAAAQLT
ncbi:unnamed protein product, partial [Notodromas monacha]